MNVLFICEANRQRSPTAEHVFRSRPGLDVRSAGISSLATVPVTVEMLEWADIVFVMEKRQRNWIRSKFPGIYERKRIVCLYIPDEFDYMDPVLVDLLEERVGQHIRE